MTYPYDEATLDLLRLTIPTYGIIVPIILRSGTNEIIDGRHRMKIREELLGEGMKITLPVHHVDTDNPAEIDQIVNSVRRPWQDAAQRQELVKKLRERGHSHQRIADAVGTHKKTVQNDLKAQSPTGEKAPVGVPTAKATKGKDGKMRKPPATPEEIARAWQMKDSGMSTPAIAKDLERGEQTVRDWFKKERPEAVQATEPPTSEAGKSDHDQTSEIRTVESNEPITPTGQISKHTKSIIAREKKTLQVKLEQVKQIRELNSSLEGYWKPLQRDWQKHGRAVVLGNLNIAEKVFLRDGVLQPLAESLGLPNESSLEDCLWAMQKEAKQIEKNIRTALYFYNCILSLTEEERPS
jgi:transposase